MRPVHRIPSLSELKTISADNLIDHVTSYLSTRKHSDQAILAAEKAVTWFAQKHWGEYRSQNMRERLHCHEDTQMLSVPIERISAVTACMNRNTHIIETLPTWLSSDRFEEIIIVDYGCLEPLEQTLGQAGLLEHPSVRLIRVEAEKWCLAEAFNVGLLQAKEPFTMKLDADTLIRGTAYLSLRLSAKQFRTGNWRTFNNNFLNGVVLAPTDAIKRVGGYNEQIRRYGWDDCDFYERLSELSLIKTDLVESDFCSLDHTDDERVANSDNTAKSNNINRLIQGNRVITNLLPKWTDKTKRQFAYHSFNEAEQQLLEVIRDFSYRISKIQDDYIHSNDAEYSYNSMLRDIASQISKDTNPGKDQPSDTKSQIVLMVSLYEDGSPTRRQEMIRCLRINSQIFNKVIALYEQPSSIGFETETSVGNELNRLAHLSSYERHLADIEIIAISNRPAYRDFFEICKTREADGNMPWYVIANADIAFDRSIERLSELDSSDKDLVWLSRWDKCTESSIDEISETYLDSDEERWKLIHSTINGARIPNYLSADAWGFKKLPPDWETYTYQLGTYFCDSFVANRAFRSGLKLVNPCYSIRCFHHHDETINSSSQKFENKKLIESLYNKEKDRLKGEDPVAGVQWASLELLKSQHFRTKTYRWNANGGIVLRLGRVTNLTSTILMIEAALQATEALGIDLYIYGNYSSGHLETALKVLEFADYLDNSRLFMYLGCIGDELLSPASPSYIDISGFNADDPGCWTQMAKIIYDYLLTNSNAHHPDLTHTRLLQLLLLKDLYSVKFLNSKYPDYFESQLFEAGCTSRLFSQNLKPTPNSFSPRFSLITSLFKAASFLPRMFENYEAIASLGQCELILLDANHDEKDAEIAKFYISLSQFKHTINYIRLPEDPGLYGCWMKGISLSQSELVSNFNADDRRSPIHPFLLADFLESDMSIAACATAISPTYCPNLSWFERLESVAWFDWYNVGQVFTLEDFIIHRDGKHCSQNIAHCMPMWRKSLHTEIGPFREDIYGTSADWAFWLEALTQGYKIALAENKPLGLYFINMNSHNRRNDQSGYLENKILKDYYGIDQVDFIQQ